MKSPSEAVVKKLFALSLNQCAFPKCTNRLVDPSGAVTGKICHIKARKPGRRYDPAQTDDERHGFDNLILLCGQHHDIVDGDPNTFTVDLLKQFKRQHERKGVIELSQEDARLARRLLDSYLHVEAAEDAQVMVNSPGATQIKNVFQRPPPLRVVLERPEGAVSPAQAKQIQKWIKSLAENTLGMTRRQAFPMWQERFKNRFDLVRYDQLLATQFEDAEGWYKTQKAMLAQGLKTKAPDAWRNEKYAAIKAAMRDLNLDNETYYPQLATRLGMRKPFSSLKDLTKRDLERVYSMVRRAQREKGN